jgi:hypothetical protein
MNLVQMAEMYFGKRSAYVRITIQGGNSFEHLAPEDFLHTKSTWENMGIMKRRLLHSVRYNEYGGEHGACMTMNGLEIDPESQEFERRLLNSTTYPATLIRDCRRDTGGCCIGEEVHYGG